MSRNALSVVAGELIRSAILSDPANLNRLIGPVGAIRVSVANPGFMNTVKFIEASELVVGAFDETGVGLDIGASLECNKTSISNCQKVSGALNKNE